jgi:autotransporter-associated beta strand protein
MSVPKNDRRNFKRHARFAAVLIISCAFIQGHCAADSQQTYLQCLTNFETYAESIWHNVSGANYPTNAGYWGDGGSTGNGGIRGSCGIAVAYATLVQALPGDPRNPTRISRITQALNYAAQSHFTGNKLCVDNNHWGWNSGTLATCTSDSGSDWQSAEWSGSLGLACILAQSNLPAQTIADCQRVVASEATHRASIAPCSGYVSDTKSEENAWDSNILALGAAWMSTNANAGTWLNAAKQYLVNTYTLANTNGTPNTNGDPLASWVTTVTLFPNWSLQNHGFYHPTYEMVGGMSLGDSLLMARLANPSVATQLQAFAEHNVMAVWTNNLSSMVMDSSDFAYPAGLDWELHDYEQNSYITWIAAHFNDPLARWTDTQLAQVVRARQIVNGNGTFVGPSGGGFYREAVEARRTAIAWLQWANADYPTGPITPPGPALASFPDVGIIVQRSTNGFVSLSYGSRIMAMVEAPAPGIPTNLYVATPLLPGVIGMGAMGNPTSAQLVSFITNANGFDAQLQIQNGANGSTMVYVKSTGETVGIVEVPFPAAGVVDNGASSFDIGVENDPLTGGSRSLNWSGGATTVANFSGTSLNIMSSWVCISGHYGLAIGPAGYMNYTAATGYNRLGAAQDTLQFQPTNSLAPRYAVWFPGKDVPQTSNSAGAITWTVSGNNAVLTFPGLAGASAQISASLLPPATISGTWDVDASGNWSDTNNWSGGTVAGGAGYTADFSAVTLTADRTVTLDNSRAIGTLKFGSGSSQNWTLNSSGGSVLTLDSGSSASPSIAVLQNTATVSASLAGNNGFTKSGTGTLVLSGSNSLSGTFFLDTGSTSGSGSGAVRVTTTAALANATGLSIRNNSGTANGSTLLLDGSGGTLTITQPFTNSCRANTIPNVENFTGSNILSGPIYMQTGGSNVVFQSDAGTLVLSGSLQYIGNLTAGRWLNFFGSGDTVVAGPVLFSAVAPINVAMFGSGQLSLNGTNTYAGSTTINSGKLLVNGTLSSGPVSVAGTLGGTGVINGPVNVLASGTLASGNNALGTLTISNALTNSGTVTMRLSKTGSFLTNDTIRGLTTFVSGGTLQLSSVGSQITVGDSFKLLFAANYLGAFTNVLPTTPGPGLVWNTNALANSGTLSVGLGTVVPQFGAVSLSGTNLVLNGSGGAAGYAYSVLGSTNLSSPRANWTLVGTGVCDSAGGFSFTNSFGGHQRFFTIRIP